MTLNEYSEIATIIQSIVAVPAAIAAGIAAWLVVLQIKSQHEENMKWKTLDICAQYEFNNSVANAARKVQAAFDKGIISEQLCTDIYRDAKIVLNYLDGIAIGIKQGLYIEALARDHLKQIVRVHVERLLDFNNCKRLQLNS